MSKGHKRQTTETRDKSGFSVNPIVLYSAFIAFLVLDRFYSSYLYNLSVSD